MESENNSVLEEKSDSDSKNFPDFGVYTVKENFSFEIPNAKVTMQRLSEDKYNYARENIERGTSTESLISIRTKDLEVEFAPSFPIHVPAYRTDYMFLKFKKPIFVSMKSSTNIFVPVPIENSIFFTGEEIREHVDVFACHPIKSRFALYGPPEHGKLCKQAEVEIEYKEKDFEPFLYAKMKVTIVNELDQGMRLGKLIFPITNHDLYYKGKSAAFDDLRITIKGRIGAQIGDVDCVPNPPKGWKKAPRHMEKTEHNYTMEKGFE